MILSTDAALLASVWVTGLMGSTHCVGMCGGISTALSFALPADKRKGFRFFGYQILYNFGRIFTYTMLGIIVGTLAHGILAGWANSPWPRMFAGGFMIAIGLYLAGWWNGLQRIEALGGGIWKTLAPWRKKILPVNHPLKAVVAGALWGFLPCGLVYSALTLALARADALVSGAVMLAFGLGTLPALLLTGALASKLRQHLQMRSIRKLTGLLVIILGFWTGFIAFSHSVHLRASNPYSGDTKDMKAAGEHVVDMHHHDSH